LRSADLERLGADLDAAGHSQAVLSHPETLAALGCFEMPVEDWPVSNPFGASGNEILTQFEHTL